LGTIILLQAAKYQTLVLAFDEVNEVALDNLKPLWDPPERQFYDLKHDINLIMLVSAKTEVWDKTTRLVPK
jgi:hypothetical protein